MVAIFASAILIVIFSLISIRVLTIHDKRSAEEQAKDILIEHLVETSNEKLIPKIACDRIETTDDDLSIGVKYHIGCRAISLENNWTIYLEAAFGARDRVAHYALDGAPNG